MNRPISIMDLAQACRDSAEQVLRRHQKLASLDLYRVLQQCLGLCEACRGDERAVEQLRQAIVAEAAGTRSYVEHGSDVYVVVCRYVFAKDESRANTCRYAHALREAAKLGLDSSSLYSWLAKNGGVNALYLRRPLEAAVVSTKLIRLDRSVTVPKAGEFALTLERRSDNVFAVVGVSPAPPPKEA